MFSAARHCGVTQRCALRKSFHGVPSDAPVGAAGGVEGVGAGLLPGLLLDSTGLCM